MNHAGPSTDNMKRECTAIFAIAMLDQHKRQGRSGVALGVFWGELHTGGGSICVHTSSICAYICSVLHISHCWVVSGNR